MCQYWSAKTACASTKTSFVAIAPSGSTQVTTNTTHHDHQVTSGSTPEAAAWVDDLYGSIIAAGTHSAPSFKVAEAAQLIENPARSKYRIIKELAIISRYISINTHDVLDAAGTKRNFLNFRLVLVGAHCVDVYPYYLTHKAERIGYYPQVVLAFRRINDGMGRWLVKVVFELGRSGKVIVGARVGARGKHQ